MGMIYRLGDDQYIEWSSICDAPLTEVMPYAEAFQRFGPERMVRVEAQGHSAKNWTEEQTPEQLVSGNRAGPNEECLTLDALLRRYAPGADSDAPLTPEEIEPR